jgi:hypothetical protein
MKTLLAATALIAMISSSALAQTAAQRARIQQYTSHVIQSDVRTAASSLDGRIEGHARTCGQSSFQYDGEGTPTGPYCH